MENVKDASAFFRENKCIWMDAGVVAYKLCDQNYDCEKCSFDFVMRNTWKEQADSEQVMLRFANNSLIDKVIRNIFKISYNEELKYLKNQLVLKHMFGGVYTIGISELLPALLENIDEVKLLTGYGYVKKDEPVISIKGRWGEKEIFAPMNFTVLQKLDIEADDFPDDTWFGVISVPEAELNTVEYSYDKFRGNNHRLMARLHNYMKTVPEAGFTMMDGGRKCNYLYEVLGKAEFGQIISDLF
jgi:glycine cleavage system H lipoate-binding protein